MQPVTGRNIIVITALTYESRHSNKADVKLIKKSRHSLSRINARTDTARF